MKEAMLSTRHQKEEKMRLANEEREYEANIRKEMEMIKRENKLENVERISRANAHH